MSTEPRILVAARLSRVMKGREQLSIERQDDAARRYATEVGDNDPIVVADPGISGSVSPFKRPNLAPFLTNSPPMPWNELVASAIDRLGRNARDLYELRNWCEDHGKRITILSPRLHWPPDENDFASPIVWTVLEQLAEIELRMTKKRYAETRELVRTKGSILNKPCWGFRITGSKLQKTLVPAPDKVSYLLAMIDMAFAGKTQKEIAAWLDSEGVKPTYAGKTIRRQGKEITLSDKWSSRSVALILRNESLYGVQRDKGKILLRHEGVISKERWDMLQEKMDSHPHRPGPKTRTQPMMLTDILYCINCHRIMHGRRLLGLVRKDGTRGPTWEGYRCDGTQREPSTCKNMIPAKEIEDWVSAWVTTPGGTTEELFAAGDKEIIATMQVPAKGHAEEITEIDQEIDALDKNEPGYLTEVNRLYTAREHLIALGTEPAHTEDKSTGITVAAYWQSLDTTAAKRAYLLKAGIKVYANRTERRITGDPSKVIGALTHP